MAKKPIALIIMDGYGINQNTEGNAIVAAKKPHLDKLLAEYPHSQLSASGLDVGLPDGQMGNSEVGHTNIGAGRIVYQMLVKISKDINDGKIYENKALSDAMDAAKANGKSLHLMGLLSNGGVPSHNEHLYGLLKMAKKKGIENVYVHTFLDGRDVPPTSGAEFMAELEKEIKEKEDRLNELDELLADPAVSTNSAKLNEISKEQNEISERLDELMDQWEILSDQLD